MTAWNKPTSDPEWATSGPSTDPGSAQRAAGYADGQTLPHDEFNWLVKTHGEHLTWLGQSVDRRFSTISQALQEASEGDVVLVSRISGDVEPIGDFSFTSGMTPALLCTDGRYVFSVENSDRVVCRERHESFEINADWGDSGICVPHAGLTITAIACDGQHVFVGYACVALQTQIAKIDASDGSVLSTRVLAYGQPGGQVTKIVTNGQRFAYAWGSELFIRDISDYADWNTDDAGVDIIDLAIDSGVVYVISDERTNAPVGDTVVAFDANFSGTAGGAPTLLWSEELVTATDPPSHIASDGLFVWITLPQASQSIYCYSRAGVYAMKIDQSDVRTLISVDDLFVYTAEEGSGGLTIYDKRTGVPVGWVSATDLTDVISIDVDGCHLIGVGDNSGGNPGLFDVCNGRGPTRFLVADPTSKGRRPFHKAAIPLGGGA